MIKYIMCFVFLFYSTTATALEIENVTIPETIGTDLQLNGAGIRSKFFFNIYIAELYLEHPSANAKEILTTSGKKRMTMHILYDTVGKEKLTDGWNEGFATNLSSGQLHDLQSQIQAFNTFFVDVHEGDEIILDYTPENGTTVTIAEDLKGTIKGASFNQALLSIWIGDAPVSDNLREDLLGIH